MDRIIILFKNVLSIDIIFTFKHSLKMQFLNYVVEFKNAFIIDLISLTEYWLVDFLLFVKGLSTYNQVMEF